MVAQILAVIIFLAMFVLIVLEVWERHIITLGCGLLTLVLVFGLGMHSMSAVLETLNLGSFFTSHFWYTAGQSAEASSGINWETIVFVAGMMIMVEGMARVGFFRWLCMRLAKMVKYKVVPLFVTFMVLSGILAMFIDSITVILFLAAVTIELSQLLKFNPVPMILAEVFCANLGGSATMCGDPPNIIIGTALGYTFTDFIENTGVIVGICFVFVLIFFWLCFRKPLKASEAARPADAVCPAPATAIANRKAFVADVIVFLIAVALLVTHAQTGLTVACIGVIVACLTLLVTVFTNGGAAVKEVIRGVDYKTLLFFIGLFISVAGLEQTGVLKLIAQFISTISGGSIKVVIVIILLLSAVCSALIDNIPFAATMVPVIQSIAATQGMDLSVLAWALSLGTDLGGNATPIGASANVVATSVSAKSGHPISWGKYCKYCVPATLLVVAVSLGCLFLRYL